jgi:DNA-binding transcriptional LysR family regulator
MELHQLRYFCAVARTGNFTRAAENQHIAQPSLSQQIHKLENELGARLFDRFPRSARLTESGKAFLPRAETILRRVDQAEPGKDYGPLEPDKAEAARNLALTFAAHWIDTVSKATQ